MRDHGNILYAISAFIGALVSAGGFFFAHPALMRWVTIFRDKKSLSDAYYSALQQLRDERIAWKETATSWKDTATALRSEMSILKERISRVESDLAVMIPKYKAAIRYIRDLLFHLDKVQAIEHDVPPIPPILDDDLKEV